jgi:hypothetical protein
MAHFGSFFPQPVNAKATGLSIRRTIHGIGCLARFVGSHPEVPAVAVVGIVGSLWLFIRQMRVPRPDFHTLFALALLAGSLSFTVTSGGDWMEGGRFVVHFLPLLFIVIAVLATGIRWRRAFRRGLIGGLAAMQVLGLLYFAAYASTGMPLWCRALDEEMLYREFEANRFSWFERRNRVHVRDIPVVYQMDRVVARILERRGGPVNILSGQMGFVLYHLSCRYLGQIRTTDLRGLADRTFTRCAVLQDVPRRSGGLDLSYETYFGRLKAILRDSGGTVPDIIFDCHLEDAEVVARCGFTVVFQQKGQVETTCRHWTGRGVSAEHFIAIRTDLLQALGDLSSVPMAFADR